MYNIVIMFKWFTSSLALNNLLLKFRQWQKHALTDGRDKLIVNKMPKASPEYNTKAKAQLKKCP